MASSLNLSWEADPARRERLINEAVDRTMPAARAGALAELRSLALVPANKKMMWSDSSVKSALLAGAKESETVSVRESSLATLYLLSLTAMEDDIVWALEVKGALLAGARAHEQIDLRERALSTLQSFTRAKNNCLQMWGEEQVRETLLAAAGPSEHPRCRQAALGALYGLAVVDANKVPMWEYGALKDVLLSSAGQGEPPNVRASALRAIQNLASTPSNMHSIWKDAKARETLLAAAEVDEQQSVREVALRSLCELANATDNLEPMWTDEGVKRVLVANADVSQSPDVREPALLALYHLSCAFVNQGLMWTEAALKSALISSAAEREQLNVRELALAVLWNLTGILADADAGRRQRASHQQYTSTVYDRGLSARIAVRVKALQSGEQANLEVDHTLEADVARMTAFKHVEQFALKHFQINELPVEARSLLIRSLEKETYPSGTDFIKQGDRGEKLYVLVEGSVEFVKDDVAVSTGHAPTLLGDLSIIYGTLRSISVRVASEANAFFSLHRDVLHNVIAIINTPAVSSIATSTGGTSPGSMRPSGSQPDLNLKPAFGWDRIDMKDLESLAILGKGGFSCVTLVRHINTKEMYALKTMSKSIIVQQDLSRKILAEKRMLEQLRGSDFCLKLYQTDRDDDFVYLLTEAASGGDLMAHMVQQKTMCPEHTQFYAACLQRALAHCHAAGFAHRDVKPENCLIMNNGYLKLADMGLCKYLPGDNVTYTMCGTPEFLAPEFIFKRGYDHRVDWWAYGCILFEMLSARNPFANENLKKMFEAVTAIGTGEAKLQLDEQVERANPPLASFLRQLLCGLDTRLGAKHADEVAQHAFFAQMGFDWERFDELETIPPVKPTKTLQERYLERRGHPGQFYFDVAPAYVGTDVQTDAADSDFSFF